MKNVINYYYHLYPDNIHQKDKKFFFQIDKIKYLFVQFDKNINKTNDIQKISDLLTSKGIKHNQIIKNITNNTITIVNNIPYILLKINIDNEENIILEDLISFNSLVRNVIIEKIDLKITKRVWMDKVDYFEYQVSQFGIKFPIIRRSFNYFIGLAESAIILLNNIINLEISRTLCHYRIFTNMKIEDLYNPINFILDNKVRDICEFFKKRLFITDNIELIIYYFNYNNVTNEEVILFLARLLYPTYYFDICEQIIEGANDNGLKQLLDRITIYEKNLKQVYYFLKQKYKIPDIEWLI